MNLERTLSIKPNNLLVWEKPLLIQKQKYTDVHNYNQIKDSLKIEIVPYNANVSTE